MRLGKRRALLQNAEPMGLGFGSSWLEANALLYDTFSTAESAPLTSPRTCEPGPGTLTVVDTANLLSITGGLVSVASGATDWSVYDSSTRSRTAGLCACLKSFNHAVGADSGATRFGWDDGVDYGYQAGAYIYPPSNTLRVYDNDLLTGKLMDPIEGTDYSFWTILRNNGAFFAIFGGVYTRPTLLWIADGSSAGTLAAGVESHTTGQVITFDDFSEVQLADYNAAWGTDDGIATYANASPTANDTDTSEADAVHQFTWTVTASETLALYIRRTDDNNAWIIRGAQAGSTIKIIEIDGGGETERGSSAQTWTPTTAYDLQFYADDETIEVFVDRTSVVSYTSASFNKTVTGTKCAGFATGADWNAFPRDVSSLLPPGMS